VTVPANLAIIAGNGIYPLLMARAARAAGVNRLVAAAFQNETDPALAGSVDAIEWMRVGQLGKLLAFLENSGCSHAVMSGQIHPKNLFDLRPDVKALMLLAKLGERNAETIFGAIADEIGKVGVQLLPATVFMDEYLAPPGLIAGPKLSRRETEDVAYGFRLAKEISRLNIGQTVVVKGRHLCSQSRPSRARTPPCSAAANSDARTPSWSRSQSRIRISVSTCRDRAAHVGNRADSQNPRPWC
jgi:DUF1009 family protein